MRKCVTIGLQWNAPTPADRHGFPPEQVFEAGLRHHHIANTAYPIHHATTMRAYLAPWGEVEPLVQAAWRDIGKLSLYVHVPFCKARCKYCEYCVLEPGEHEAEDAYFDALLRKFDLCHDPHVAESV